MLVKQVSVFLENSKGRLYEVSHTLSVNQININGISLADTTDYGILRLAVQDPDFARKVLKENGFIVELTDVIAISIADTPGEMAKAFEKLTKEDISVEYLYAVNKIKFGTAVLVLKTNRPEDAVKALEAGGVRMLTEEEFYSL